MNKTPWVILLILWMMGSAWWHVCKIKQICPDVAVPDSTADKSELVETPPGADAFTIADSNYFRLELPGNFSFAKSDANANLNTLGGSLASLVLYLKNNPNRTVRIIGYYAPNEANLTTLPDLGLARAEGMKQYLIQQGLPAASITIEGEQRKLPFNASRDSIRGGLTFAFAEANKPTAPSTPVTTDTTATASAPTNPTILNEPITEKELAEKEKFTSVFKPMDLYFPLSEANYIKTNDTQKFFEEAIKYLAEHKNKKLLLTGHTDNSGPSEVNMRLSLDRANDVKSKLRQSGIRADQITVRAKGETEPKVDNRTISGRKANRRVTVVVND